MYHFKIYKNKLNLFQFSITAPFLIIINPTAIDKCRSTKTSIVSSKSSAAEISVHPTSHTSTPPNSPILGTATLVHKINPQKGEEKVFIAKKVLISKMDEKDKKGSLLEVRIYLRLS